MATRIIVDENVHHNSPLWSEFQRLLGKQSWEYVYLKDAHPGIPDVEILDKLLKPGVVLLTGDCVLHERAIQQGTRSYTLNKQGQLTSRRQKEVKVPGPLPRSVHAELLSDYRLDAENEITNRLRQTLSDRHLKRCRTARRRIRSHFGSAKAIGAVSLTVGSRQTRSGLLCGYVMKLGGGAGPSGLRGTEGYCRPTTPEVRGEFPLLHALRDLYLLQLENVFTEIFVVPRETLELGQRLVGKPVDDSADPFERCLSLLLNGLRKVVLHPCEKGRFFDAMEDKLTQLLRTGSNEVTKVDFLNVANTLLDSGNTPMPQPRESEF